MPYVFALARRNGEHVDIQTRIDEFRHIKGDIFFGHNIDFRVRHSHRYAQILIFLNQGKILVQQRDAALLRGLWVFLLLENDDTPEGLEKKLRSMGIEAALQSDLGEAKHVFTHRIWNMKIYHFEASDVRKKPGYQFVTADELSALPMPTAVKVARKWAIELLK